MGLAQSNIQWDNLIDYVYSINKKHVPMILFTTQPYTDGCELLDKPIQTIATQKTLSSGKGVFVTGHGECHKCHKPKLYYWSRDAWISKNITGPDDLSTNLLNITNDQGIYYIYLLEGDQDHTIVGVKEVYYRNKNSLHPQPGARCNPNKQGFLENSSQWNWWVVLLIIVIVILLILIFMKNRKPQKEVPSPKRFEGPL